ncbi:MAG: Phosphoglucosamine mutase [Evtepia sp.]|nr:Phosphoglucosamine mutase [Evtepia sp.]
MSYLENYEEWINSPSLSPQDREELRIIAGNQAEMESRFFGPLEFGTAGLRGIMGVGLNRMNSHVIRHATQAFAEVILAEGSEAASRGVAICFDCRNHSEEFAREASCVMVANGIPVRLFSAMRPTPELSFAVREYSCIAGINVTASHNPKEYNGYKVYWSDGAQLPPQHAAAIAKRMSELNVFTSIKILSFEQALSQNLVALMSEETDQKFISHVMSMANNYEAVARVADTFCMVYTPFHGTGYQQIPEVLTNLGVKKLYCVPEQMVIDGNFPTVKSPNPENPESFFLAIQLAKEKNADFILGSDPDADRVGILVCDRFGDYQILSGNQTGVLLLDYLIGAKRRKGTLPSNPVALKTIVTTEMARQVALQNGVACFDTFTGFKFMAEKKNSLEASGEGTVIFSYEESFGYMVGDYVRDKDAVTASLLLTEMAAYYAGKGMTLLDALDTLYENYGFYEEKTLNLMMPGLEGMSNMKALMDKLRKAPISSIAETPVLIQIDHLDGTEYNLTSNTVTKIELAGSNVLKYRLEDGTDIVVRPSGTEPKLKVYILAHDSNRNTCHERISRYTAWAEQTLQ